MTPETRQQLIKNTKRFLKTKDLYDGGLCWCLSDRAENYELYSIVSDFMKKYTLKSCHYPYISKPGQVTPERIVAAQDFLKWLETPQE